MISGPATRFERIGAHAVFEAIYIALKHMLSAK